MDSILIQTLLTLSAVGFGAWLANKNANAQFRRTTVSNTLQQWSIELRNLLAEFTDTLAITPSKRIMSDGAPNLFKNGEITWEKAEKYIDDYKSIVSRLNILRNKICLMLNQSNGDEEQMIELVDSAVQEVVQKKNETPIDMVREIFVVAQGILQRARRGVTSGEETKVKKLVKVMNDTVNVKD